MKALKIKISGKILRTGYRWYIVEIVRETNLAGYVEFTPEGDLSIHLQGEENIIQEIIEKIRNPPPPTQIKQFNVEEVKPDPKLKTFTIKYGTIGDELHEGFGPIEFALDHHLGEIVNIIGELKKSIDEISGKIDQLYDSQKDLIKALEKLSDKLATR